jgi:CheY-like chemotaxis protein
VTIVDEKNRGFSLGASEYLVKPVDRDKLVSVLQRLSTPPGDQILVVDDEESSRSSLRMALEQAGWRAVEADNGRVALARLNEMRPSAILLDLMMPEMDGFEFLDEIRHHDKWRNIPVVVITARDITPEDRARLTGKVESIVQKAGQGDMLRQVRSELEKCLGRKARERTAPA